MTWVSTALTFATPEDGGDIVSIATGYVEERSFSRGLKMRDGGLNDVARAIKLVVVSEVCPAVLGFDGRVVGV